MTRRKAPRKSTVITSKVTSRERESSGGGPAILGTWIAGFAYSPLLSAVFLAVGAGAIMQVIYEVGRMLLRDSLRRKVPALSASNLGGLTAGIAVMYATALLVGV